MGKYILIIIALLIINVDVSAQVTVGSDNAPVGGALLQLKERESTSTDATTADKGFSNARVALTKNDELYPMYAEGYPDVDDIAAEKKANVGLVVYNVTSNAATTPTLDIFVPGLYIWNGTNWTLLQSEKVVDPSIESIECGTATLTPASYTAGSYYIGILRVPYIGGNGGNYDASTIPAVTENGLSFKLESGKLNVGNGFIYYQVTGVPTISSPEPTAVPINFLAKSCVATVGNVQEVKSINFTKTKAEGYNNNTVPDLTTTSLGNLSVRIEYIQYSLFNSSYFLTYKVATPSQVTLLYTKSGTSVGYMVTGRKPAQDINAWYRVKTGAYGGDGGLILENSATTGPAGNKDDLNPSNRDVIQAIFMLHNTNEVYRITINSNGAINASGPIVAVPATITIFLEKLD